MEEPVYESAPLMIDHDALDFAKDFVEEANEHIEAIELAVLEVERVPGDTARLDDLLRPFHTIKGLAGFLNLRDIICLTHEVETLLDQARRGERTITSGLIYLVLEVADVLKVQVGAVADYVKDPTGAAAPQPAAGGTAQRARG